MFPLVAKELTNAKVHQVELVVLIVFSDEDIFRLDVTMQDRT